MTRDKSLVTADLACLRAALSGADRLPRPVKERFEALVAQRGGQVKLLEGYGLTEAVTAVMAMPRGEYREGSVGVPFSDMLAKICSPGTLEEVPPGREGEICIAGPTVMIGYLDDPEATRQALRQHADGRVWLHTGDLGRMDADGFFYFTDRLKRMIKASGFNVFPAQVEAVLYTHPQVLETCVVGVPDPAQVERVKAFVVLKNRALPGPNTEKELIALCRSQLIKWSCPREIEFRRELPKTRIGKIDYQALVAEHVAQARHKAARQPRRRSRRRSAAGARCAPRVHAVRRAHLADSHRRQGARPSRRRRARRSDRRVRRRRSGAAHRRAWRGRGDRGSRRHQYADRAQERAARPVARRRARRRRPDRAAGPRRAAGHQPGAGRRAPRQARETGSPRP